MKIKTLHRWDLTPKEAAETQQKLRSSLRFLPWSKEIRVAVGVDLSFSAGSDVVYASAVAWDAESGEVAESALEKGEARFPYIPGLLAFRELPVITEALKKLKTAPDIILVDGHGICHPRGMGIASHLGLMVDVPTIGCAKKKLVGTFEPPAGERFSSAPLYFKDEIAAVVLRSRANVKPIFVSPGNLIDLPSSEKAVKKLLGKYRIPEPLRWAHIKCNEYRRSFSIN